MLLRIYNACETVVSHRLPAWLFQKMSRLCLCAIIVLIAEIVRSTNPVSFFSSIIAENHNTSLQIVQLCYVLWL